MTTPAVGRRAALAGVASLGSAVAGCVGSGRPAVDVLAAGSLARPFEAAVGPAFEAATGHAVSGEYRGSAALLRLVAAGHRRPDVVVSADARLMRDRIDPDWDVAFASNALCVAYAPDTDAGRRLAAGEPWYEVLRDARAARTDPALDPLGYRTVQLFQLAESRYGVAGLAAALRESVRVAAAEAHLLAGVERGAYEAAVCYENMAVGRDLPFVDLPAALDFSDPARADGYAEASFETASGSIPGRPVLYAATVPPVAAEREAGRRFVRLLCERPGLLREWGLSVPPRLPAGRGPVPAGVLP